MLERIDATKRLWQIAIPQCPAPLESQLLWWLETFTDTEVEHAIRRTSKKFRKVGQGTSNPETITKAIHETFYKYTTGVLLNERKGVTPPKAAQTTSAAQEVK